MAAEKANKSIWTLGHMLARTNAPTARENPSVLRHCEFNNMHVQRLMYVYSMVVLVSIVILSHCSTYAHGQQAAKSVAEGEKKDNNRRPSNVPSCLATGKCKFWGKQFDCSMCPGSGRNVPVETSVHAKCEEEKNEIENLQKSKRLMIKELYDALNTLVEEKSLTQNQKSMVLDKLGMESSNSGNDVALKYKRHNFQHVVSVSSIYDNAIENSKNLLNYQSSDIDQPIFPNINVGNDVSVHKFLRQRHKRLQRKIKKRGDGSNILYLQDSLKLVLREEQAEIFTMQRRHSASTKRRKHRKHKSI